MFATVWFFLGLVGTLSCIGAFYTRFEMSMRLIFSLFSTFAWGIWAFESFEVQVATDSGVVTQSYIPLVMLGFAIAFVMLLFTVRNGFEVVGVDVPLGR